MATSDEKKAELLRLLEWGPENGFPRSLEEAMQRDAEENDA